jgi:hypothetical protein
MIKSQTFCFVFLHRYSIKSHIQIVKIVFAFFKDFIVLPEFVCVFELEQEIMREGTES